MYAPRTLETGLCAYLTQWSSPETLEAGAMAGAIGLIAYITLAVLKAACQRVHDAGKIQEEFSGSYLADKLGAVYRRMLIPIPADEWAIVSNVSFTRFLLIELAQGVNMRRLKKHPREAKKKQK